MAIEEAQKTKKFVRTSMGFTRASDVVKDHEREGLLRATEANLDEMTEENFHFPSLNVIDCSQDKSTRHSLEKNGFETLDLSRNKKLQKIFERIRTKSHLSKRDINRIRQAMALSTFKLSNGKKLRLLYIAPMGLIMRQAGPNGLKIDEEPIDTINGNEGSTVVHGDQDVYGTPIKQIMRGSAPYVFRHKTPDGQNDHSPLFLTNIWVPLQQITRPLSLMDRETLNHKKHQLRYALPVSDFLERDEDQSLNDVWTFLYDDKQQWYFNSEMDANSAWIFDTLGMPHGAIFVPGEKEAERCYRELDSRCKALSTKVEFDSSTFSKSKTITLPEDTTNSLRRAVNNMRSLLKEFDSEKNFDYLNSKWKPQALSAMDSVVRKSIEMRVVCLLTP